MSDLKTKLDETKQFVKKHQMVFACSATAVVTLVLARNVKVAGVDAAVGSLVEVYDGRMANYYDILDFIVEKDLEEDAYNFVKDRVS